MSAQQICEVCGCTEDRACLTTAGPCHWVRPGLCSACAGVDEMALKLQPEDIEALLRLPPIRAQIDGFTALTLISAIQLACRHTNFRGQTREVVEDFARGLIERIGLTENIRAVCEAGWHAENDVPPEQPERHAGLILPGDDRFHL